MTDDAPRLQLNREQVRDVPCPRCGVDAHQPCLRVNGRPRVSNHVQRIEAARVELRTFRED